jgi:Nif-specific regulatory protein
MIQEEDLFIKNAAASGQEDRSRNLKTAINVFKGRFIRKVLEENKWNQTETAKVLDIQRTYLSRLIKELEISNAKE